jgi:hypothetical protein
MTKLYYIKGTHYNISYICKDFDRRMWEILAIYSAYQIAAAQSQTVPAFPQKYSD